MKESSAAQLDLDSLNLEIAQCAHSDTLKNLYSLGAAEYERKGQYKVALSFYNKALNLLDKEKDLTEVAALHDNLGLIYDYLGDYSQSMKHSLDALQAYQKLNDTASIANSYNNLGVLYYYQENYIKSDEYYRLSLELAYEMNDSWLQASLMNNLANIASDTGNNLEALEIYFESANVSLKEKDTIGAALTYGNIGETYTVLKKYKEAEYYLSKALKIYEQYEQDVWGVVNQYRGLGDLELQRGNFELAITYLLKSAHIAQKASLTSELSAGYLTIAAAYKQSGKFEEAYRYLELHKALEDSLFGINTTEKVLELETLYNVEQKEKQISLQNAQIENQALQKQFYIAGSIGLGLICLFTAYSLIQKRNDNRKLRNQKKEIAEKNDALNQRNNEIVAIGEKIEDQNNTLSKQNGDILSSISYAKRIQEAILPSDSKISKYLNEAFVLYKPKDIVSGDFYWMEKVGEKIFWAVVDCTGHGVPGAFMSIVGANGLKKIVVDNKIKNPAEILERLTKYVMESVVDSADGQEIKDGMDLSLCCWDEQTGILEFAGAFNPLYLIRNGELLITKGTKRPIGRYHGNKQKPFENHQIKVEEGDLLYLFSDGYADQFGGMDDSKFSYQRFRKLLLEIHDLPIEDQKGRLETAFQDWKGIQSQLDDVCIMGVRL